MAMAWLTKTRGETPTTMVFLTTMETALLSDQIFKIRMVMEQLAALVIMVSTKITLNNSLQTS